MQSEPDYVTITTGIPVAYAGEDQEVKVDDYVIIDARNSIPYPGGPAITEYAWKVPYKPEECEYDLPDHFNPYLSWLGFYVRHVGEYYFVLWVRDADGTESEPTVIKITVTSERSNPLSMDTDDDGVSDGHEYHIYGTNLNDKDSDDDGLLDGQELGYEVIDVTKDTDLSIFKADTDAGATKTDPTIGDTDGDGLYDGWKDVIANNQFDACLEEGEDTDGNGMIEGDISNKGTWDSTETWEETDPNNVDTDGDGLWDGYDVGDNWGELSTHRVGEYNEINYEYEVLELQAITYSATSPFKYDTDGDGLDDGFETGVDFLDANEEAAWNSIPNHVDDKPDPGVKDIYVEVDWMGPEQYYIETHFVEFLIPVWGTAKLIYEGYQLITTCDGHKMSPNAKKEVIKKFKNAPLNYLNDLNGIRLHIDEGIGDWNGGTSIPHYDDYIYYDGNEYYGRGNQAPLRDDSTTDDFYDFKLNPNYFNPNRLNIFHYALLVHDVDIEGYDREDAVAGSENAGDDMCIGSRNFNSWEDKAKRFMHELGHNLDLNGHTNNENTVMYAPSIQSNVIDYTYDEWNTELNLQGIDNTND